MGRIETGGVNEEVIHFKEVVRYMVCKSCGVGPLRKEGSEWWNEEIIELIQWKTERYRRFLKNK